MDFTAHQHKKAISRAPKTLLKNMSNMHKVINGCTAIKNEESRVCGKTRRSTAILRLIMLNEISTSELSKHILNQMTSNIPELNKTKFYHIIQSFLRMKIFLLVQSCQRVHSNC